MRESENPVNPPPASTGTEHPSIPDVIDKWPELQPGPIDPLPNSDGAGGAAKTGR